MTRPLLNRRLDGLGNSIFGVMSARAVATGSINLGQGFPDVDGPGSVADAAAEAILAGRGNQYPPPTGVPELRRAVARHQRRFYGLGYDPDTEVLITAGATEAIAAALLALLEPGDEVIAFEPYYDSYVANIAMAGAVRVPLTLCPPDFRPDLAKLEAMISGKTRLLLLNSPHNPTGMVLTRAETEAMARIAIDHDLLVITDEAYEHLTFDREHIPLATIPGMRERTVSIGSAGKTFSFTGWKVGWATGTPELISAVRTTKQFLTYVSSGPFQYAVAEALDLPDELLHGPWPTTSRPAATCSRAACETSASRSTSPTAPTSSPPTSPPWASTTRWSSAWPSRTGRAWSRSRAPSSTTTTRRRAAPWSGSPSASAPRCSRRRSAVSKKSNPARMDPMTTFGDFLASRARDG